MKKTILLLATVLLVGTSFAQFNSKQQNSRDNDYGYNKGKDDKFDKGHDKSYFFTAKERDMQIAQISKEAAKQIQSVKNRFLMSRSIKQRQIQIIEQKRDKDISLVMAKYNDKDNKANDKGGKGHGKW